MNNEHQSKIVGLWRNAQGTCHFNCHVNYRLKKYNKHQTAPEKQTRQPEGHCYSSWEVYSHVNLYIKELVYLVLKKETYIFEKIIEWQQAERLVFQTQIGCY